MVLLSFLFFSNIVQALAEPTPQEIDVMLQLTDSGEVLSGVRVFAANYQTAYTNISQGNFSSDIFRSFEWSSVSNPDESLTVAGLTVGNGFTHNQADAMTIIRELFTTNFKLLQTINESNDGNFGTGLELGDFVSYPSNFTSFRRASGSNDRTDSNGHAQARLSLGMTAIVSEERQLLDLVDISVATDILHVDKNPAFGLLQVEMGNIDTFRTGDNKYTVSYGQRFEYLITVNSLLLHKENPTIVTLQPSANIVIEAISMENEQIELVPNTVFPTSTFDPNGGAVALNVAATQIGSSLVNTSIFSYNIVIPPSDENITIRIEAYLSPQVRIHRQVADQNAPNEAVSLDIPINAFMNIDKNFGLTATIQGEMGTLSSQAPYINTSGINFVQANVERNELAYGSTFLLGRKEGGELYFLDMESNWSRLATGTDINPVNYRLFQGGNRYVIGMDEVNAILPATSRFNFDQEENQRINQSLIQIIGLGASETYFLYQVTPAENHEPLTNLIDFIVFRKYSVATNGEEVMMTSLNRSANQSFHLNRLIPDHLAGVNEYHLLPVGTEQKVSFNPVLRILLPLVVIVAIMFAVGIILIKVV